MHHWIMKRLNSVRTALTAIATLALCAGCDAWLTKPSLYNTVQVVVTQPNGDPVPKAFLILFTGARQMGFGNTEANGLFTFTRVPPGTYGVEAVPPAGYAPVDDPTGGPAGRVIDDLDVANDTLSPVRFTFVKTAP